MQTKNPCLSCFSIPITDSILLCCCFFVVVLNFVLVVVVVAPAIVVAAWATSNSAMDRVVFGDDFLPPAPHIAEEFHGDLADATGAGVLGG